MNGQLPAQTLENVHASNWNNITKGQNLMNTIINRALFAMWKKMLLRTEWHFGMFFGYRPVQKHNREILMSKKERLHITLLSYRGTKLKRKTVFLRKCKNCSRLKCCVHALVICQRGYMLCPVSCVNFRKKNVKYSLGTLKSINGKRCIESLWIMDLSFVRSLFKDRK